MSHPKPTDLDMTKHSDCFVWKDTSERVARRCDYIVDEKRVNSRVLKHLFLEGVKQPNNIAKKTRKCILRRATNVTFSKFRGWRRKTKVLKTQPRFFETALRAVLIN